MCAEKCLSPSRLTYLVRGKLNSSVDVNQLEGHSKVLVAICCEGALGFGRIIHPERQKAFSALLFHNREPTLIEHVS